MSTRREWPLKGIRRWRLGEEGAGESARRNSGRERIVRVGGGRETGPCAYTLVFTRSRGPLSYYLQPPSSDYLPLVSSSSLRSYRSDLISSLSSVGLASYRHAASYLHIELLRLIVYFAFRCEFIPRPRSFQRHLEGCSFSHAPSASAVCLWAIDLDSAAPGRA